MIMSLRGTATRFGLDSFILSTDAWLHAKSEFEGYTMIQICRLLTSHFFHSSNWTL